MEEKKYYMKSVIFMKIFLIPYIIFILYIFYYSVNELINNISFFYIIMLPAIGFLLFMSSYFFKVSFMKVPMLEINNEQLIIRTNIFKKEVFVRDINAVFGNKIFTNRVIEVMLHNGRKIVVPLNQIDCDVDEVVGVIKEFAGLNQE